LQMYVLSEKVCGPKKGRLDVWKQSTNCLSTFATDPASELDVLWHDGHTLGVNGAKVGVLEQTDQISFAGFLKCHDGRALESQVSLEVLSDFTD